MSLFGGGGILLSVPNRLLRPIGWRAAIVGADAVADGVETEDLRIALDLVRAHARRRGVPLKCILHPDIYPRDRLSIILARHAREFDRHLCLTDGQAVSLIEGLANYIFFYASSHADGPGALDRLTRRAPEIAPRIVGQVNSNLVLGPPRRPGRPVPTLLLNDSPRAAGPFALKPFVFSEVSAEDTVQRFEAQPPAGPDLLTACDHILYMPLTSTALADPAFARVLADFIFEICHEPANVLVLRLPVETEPGARVAHGLTLCQQALSRTGIILPRSTFPNVVVADADLTERELYSSGRPVHLYIHDSFDFWRHSRLFYAAATAVTVLADDATREGPVVPSDQLAVAYGPLASRRSIGQAMQPRRAPVASPAGRSARPRLTMDIGPLFETVWTGIPVFTRRLVQALASSDQVDLAFMYRMTPIPEAVVASAIRARTGVGLRDYYATEAPAHALFPDLSGACLYPMVKEMGGVAAREASTIHDLTTLTMPGRHLPGNVDYHLDHIVQQIATDQRTFCASEVVRQALVQYYPSSARRARVLYQYVDWPDYFEELDRNSYPFETEPYAIVVGTVEPRKNIQILFEALTHQSVRDAPLKFVVVGAKNWETVKIFEQLSLIYDRKVIFTGFVSEFMKYRLIKNAAFLIFPSLYEGFGIPALEAMSLGKPVLASCCGSLPEVVGDAGVYFDPVCTDEFVEALKEISHPRRLAALEPVARARSAAFTRREMAAPILEWLGEF
jgi:glycosyltransferase involved in cell wall biosynthesis